MNHDEETLAEVSVRTNYSKNIKNAYNYIPHAHPPITTIYAPPHHVKTPLTHRSQLSTSPLITSKHRSHDTRNHRGCQPLTLTETEWKEDSVTRWREQEKKGVRGIKTLGKKEENKEEQRRRKSERQLSVAQVIYRGRRPKTNGEPWHGGRRDPQQNGSTIQQGRGRGRKRTPQDAAEYWGPPRVKRTHSHRSS